MSNVKHIFIVGSSRSGTTMLSRILGNHSDIFTFKEIHFFGTIWTKSSNKNLNKQEQIDLLSRLFCIQENGLFKQDNISDFNEKARIVLANKNIENPLSVYELFLAEITSHNESSIACDQTPKNIYYLNEILSYFPEAKVINMIRDQRDVLLSQKNKWKRRFLGASEIPLSESIRSYINYHPILTAKIWNSSLLHTSKYITNDRVMIIRFEKLLSSPKEVIVKVCDFLGIEYQKKMLMVPVVGSSTEKDSSCKMHIDAKKIGKWKKGGLSLAEIYLSQKICKNTMKLFSYEPKEIPFPAFSLVYLITLPIKLILAFIVNFRRTGNISEVFAKQFLSR